MSTTDFQTVLQDTWSKLFRYALKLTRNEEDAKDLIQETAARAYANREKFAAGTNFGAWIHVIMRNTFINNYRRQKVAKEVEAPIDDFLFALENHSVAAGVESRLSMQDLMKLLDELPEIHRVPFLMFYRGYQYDEIAQHLDVPMGTIKSRIFFARKVMRRKIRATYGDIAFG